MCVLVHFKTHSLLLVLGCVCDGGGNECVMNFYPLEDVFFWGRVSVFGCLLYSYRLAILHLLLMLQLAAYLMMPPCLCIFFGSSVRVYS